MNDKGAFFGDFLCTGKESYPLAAGQRKLLLWISMKPKLQMPPPPASAGKARERQGLSGSEETFFPRNLPIKIGTSANSPIPISGTYTCGSSNNEKLTA